MEERLLLRISLFFTLLGIFSLFLVSHFYGPKQVSVSQIQTVSEGELVEIEGYIESIKNYEGYSIIEFAQLHKSSAILFTSENLSLPIKSHVVISGRIRNYKGENDLIVEDLRVK